MSAGSLIPITLSDPAARIVRNKPLFVPLKTEYYEAFERGAKTSELRRYGARWNEKTCNPGREVLISKGYGKKHRLRGIVESFEVIEGRYLSWTHRRTIEDLYGTLDLHIIIIHIQLSPRLL